MAEPGRPWTTSRRTISSPACQRYAPSSLMADPDLSVVVTLLNEQESLEELYRRTVSALDGRPFELILVDDGSTDGTWAAVERLHAGDPRVHAVRFKRNFGQHPAMHAGLARARGDIVVTMDGDLQNQPEDIPKLVAAVEAGADVASGRRAARNDSWGRTLPSRLINGMLRRFTGVEIADFGCAFNAYRRNVVDADARRDREAEVHEGAHPLRRRVGRRGGRRPRGASGSSRYSPLRLTRLALHVLAGFWPQPIQWIGVALGFVCTLLAVGARRLRRLVLDRPLGLPRPAARRRRRPLRPRHPGLHPRARRGVPGRIQREVEGRPLYTISEEL